MYWGARPREIRAPRSREALPPRERGRLRAALSLCLHTYAQPSAGHFCFKGLIFGCEPFSCLFLISMSSFLRDVLNAYMEFFEWMRASVRSHAFLWEEVSKTKEAPSPAGWGRFNDGLRAHMTVTDAYDGCGRI